MGALEFALILIAIIVVIVVIVFQISSFLSVKESLALLSQLFPTEKEISLKVFDEEERRYTKINYTGKSKEFKKLNTDINEYLRKNQNQSTDYHLIKDMVDRCCDSMSEEIVTQIPHPLYLGLVGTMSGIICGCLSLFCSRDTSVSWLFLCVAFAMGASALGIVFTIFNSKKNKDVQKIADERRSAFLSWIQINLLPNVSGDSLQLLMRNLNSFNEKFSENADALDTTLQSINDIASSQGESIVELRQILNVINNLNLKRTTEANVKMFKALNDNAINIEKLAEYLAAINDYLGEIRELAKKMDNQDQRLRMIEGMARFFEQWNGEMEQIKGLFVQDAGQYTQVLNSALSDLSKTISDQISAIPQQIASSLDEIQKTIAEYPQFAKTIENLPKIDQTMNRLSETTLELSKQMSLFNKQIEAQAKVLQEIEKNTKTKANIQIDAQKFSFFTPRFKKIFWSVFGVFAGISVAGIITIVVLLAVML